MKYSERLNHMIRFRMASNDTILYQIHNAISWFINKTASYHIESNTSQKCSLDFKNDNILFSSDKIITHESIITIIHVIKCNKLFYNMY